MCCSAAAPPPLVEVLAEEEELASWPVLLGRNGALRGQLADRIGVQTEILRRLACRA
jgi:hypothetical protein